MATETTSTVETTEEKITTDSSGRLILDFSARSINDDIITVSGDVLTDTYQDVTTSYTNVGAIEFLDGRLVLTPTDVSAQVVRVYNAAFGRSPDEGGLNYWIDQLNLGQTLNGMAFGFLESEEFESRYGSLDDASFVSRLYTNVLGRDADAEGLSYWTTTLAQGATRSDVLIGFSESDENKAATASLVGQGIWDRSEAAAFVARLYDTVLGRLPDKAGLAHWTEGLDAGDLSQVAVADSFMVSEEFVTRYGNLDNPSFVKALYQNILDREGDPEGVQYWSDLLDQDLPRSGLVVNFSESQEHIANTSALFGDDTHRGITFAV